MSLAVTLRPAAKADATCIAVLAMQVWLDTYATQGIRRLIADEVLAAFAPQAIEALMARPHTAFFVAECDHHLVGMAQVTQGTAQALVPFQSQAELDRLYVQEPFTRQGVGSLLLAHAERWCESYGAQALWLTPWVHNVRALRFYEHCGYTDHGATYFEMGSERHENRVLAKALNADLRG